MDLQLSAKKTVDPREAHAIVKRTITKHVMLKTAKDTNVVFSPYSILEVLSLIAAGSKGPILEKMLTCLHSKSSQEQVEFCFQFLRVLFSDWSRIGGPKVSFANGVWIDRSLSVDDSFEKAVKIVYKSALNQIDFKNKASEVAMEVNLWAEKETSGQMKDVLPPGLVDGSTRLLSVHANYYKGVWKKKFNLSLTKEDDFHLLDGNSVRAPFMSDDKRQFIGVYDGFKVLGLSYDCGKDKSQFTICIFLPDATDGLPSLVKIYCEDSGFLDRHIPVCVMDILDFKVPKFKISFESEASAVLKNLGLLLPSSGKENLTEMREDSAAGVNLLVSSFYHKCGLEVNEDGRETIAEVYKSAANQVVFKKRTHSTIVVASPYNNGRGIMMAADTRRVKMVDKQHWVHLDDAAQKIVRNGELLLGGSGNYGHFGEIKDLFTSKKNPEFSRMRFLFRKRLRKSRHRKSGRLDVSLFMCGKEDNGVCGLYVYEYDEVTECYKEVKYHEAIAMGSGAVFAQPMLGHLRDDTDYEFTRMVILNAVMESMYKKSDSCGGLVDLGYIHEDKQEAVLMHGDGTKKMVDEFMQVRVEDDKKIEVKKRTKPKTKKRKQS